MKRCLFLLFIGCLPPQEAECDQLADELARCDLPPARLACDRLTHQERRALIDRFEEASCLGIRAGDDNPDVAVCELLDWECPAPLFDSPAPQRTRHPFLFVNGIDDGATFTFNTSVLQAVQNIGPNDVYLVSPRPWSIPEVRARDIAATLDLIDAPKVNLICYAVAGLDCRYLASTEGMNDPRVASITTVATPHRGTNAADLALNLSTADYEAILAALGALEDPPNDTALQVALGRLTPEALQAFNDEITDRGDIFYQSWAGASHFFGQPYIPSEADLVRECRGEGGELLWARSGDGYDVMSPLLMATAPYADSGVGQDSAALLRPSDGMVAISSAKWGKFRGCVPADHYDLIGQIGDFGVDPSSGFDVTTFYENVAVDLAKRGL